MKTYSIVTFPTCSAIYTHGLLSLKLLAFREGESLIDTLEYVSTLKKWDEEIVIEIFSHDVKSIVTDESKAANSEANKGRLSGENVYSPKKVIIEKGSGKVWCFLEYPKYHLGSIKIHTCP